MTRGGRTISILQGLFLTLCVFALALKVALPPGVMAGQGSGSIPLVICTGHGPLALTEPDGAKAPAHSPNQTACPFDMAGVAGAAPTPPLISQPATLALDTPAAPLAPDLAPGRGLAAPPPPSQGPPDSLL